MNETNNDSITIGSQEKTSNIGFPIKFASREFGGRPTFNSFSLRGKGEIVFKDNKVILTGKRARPFWFGCPEEHVLDTNSICDVRTQGKVVVFRIGNAGEPVKIVSFTTNDKDASQAIVAHLPSRQTTEFIQHQKEQSDFQHRLDAVTPRAWVTPTLLALNVLMFVVMAFNGADVLQPSGEVAVKWGSNYGPMTLSGEYWRLFSSTFIHYGILHLALNMFALYQTGILVERLYGNFYFLVLYVFAGLSGSIVSILWHPNINSAGASGAIFGVFGGLLAFILSAHTQLPRSIVVAHRNSTVVFIGYNLINGFAHAGIDNGAHIGGLAGGLLMGFILARPLNEESRRIPWHRLAVGIAFGVLFLSAVAYTFFPR